MARGYSRNEAAELARSGYKGQPYTELYAMATIQSTVHEFMETMRKAAALAVEAVHQFYTEDFPRFASEIAQAVRSFY